MRWDKKSYLKIMIWNTMILLIIPLIFADEGLIETYKPNQIIDLSLHLINLTSEVNQANCSVQIRNSTFTTIADSLMNNTGGGWYNYTYNTSSVGKYYCRQNCTLGTKYTSNTCDFVIKGDSQLQIAIILIMGIILTFLFIFSRMVKIEAIKYLLISVTVMVLILTINIGMLMAKESLPSSIQSLLSTTYLIILYTMEFILGLGVLFLMLYYVVKWLPDTFKFKKKQ